MTHLKSNSISTDGFPLNFGQTHVLATGASSNLCARDIIQSYGIGFK